MVVLGGCVGIPATTHIITNSGPGSPRMQQSYTRPEYVSQAFWCWSRSQQSSHSEGERTMQEIRDKGVSRSSRFWNIPNEPVQKGEQNLPWLTMCESGRHAPFSSKLWIKSRSQTLKTRFEPFQSSGHMSGVRKETEIATLVVTLCRIEVWDERKTIATSCKEQVQTCPTINESSGRGREQDIEGGISRIGCRTRQSYR